MKVGILKKKQGPFLDYRKKNLKKVLRTILQILFLSLLMILFIKYVLIHERYQAPDESSWQNHDGFTAVSYFGVSRSGSETLIAKKQLAEQLEALKERGFVTITQQDILDFYQKGKPLPEKALFLSFEDGRNDSSIFAQSLSERNNFRATILTYANKFGTREFKFLQAKDLLKMKETGYWEIGSNGYRLSYINIFDKYGTYMVEMDESEFDSIESVTYNHYLMDFLRDVNGIPLEDREKMEARISEDYQLMDQIYSTELGFVPEVYMIMHANSLYNGMNGLVESTNDQFIQSLFKIHFNREGFAFNDRERNPLDLSRVQPAPHWSTNHLLMKIQADSGQLLEFVVGDQELARDWELLNGAAEFTQNKIILTSPSWEEGILVLRKDPPLTNYQLEYQTEGIPEGKQSIYLGYDESTDFYVKSMLEENQLSVIQKAGDSIETLAKIENVLEKKKKNWKVEVMNSEISVWLEDQLLVENLPVNSSVLRSSIALSSEPSKIEEEEQEFDDIYYKGNDIYDVTFHDFHLSELNGNKGVGEVLYSNKLSGIQKVLSTGMEVFNKLIDLAIETF